MFFKQRFRDVTGIWPKFPVIDCMLLGDNN